MYFYDLYLYFLVLILPGLIGALAFGLIAHCKSKCSIKVALVLDLLTFIIMITGLYFYKHICTTDKLLYEFACLSFTRKYALLSILISLVLGTIFGSIKKLCFWIKC